MSNCIVCNSSTNVFRTRYVNSKGIEVKYKTCYSCELEFNKENKRQSKLKTNGRCISSSSKLSGQS